MTHGELYFSSSRERVRVDLDEALVAQTRAAAREARALAAGGVMPPPLEDSPKCRRCSLVGICLPGEVRALRGEGEEGEAAALRRLVPAQQEKLPLHVQEQAAQVGKRGELLEISHQGEVLGKARVRELSHVALYGQVAVTAQALRHLCEEGVPIAHFSYGGWFYGLTRGHDHKNIERRVRQFEAARDPGRALALARRLVWGKIRNARVFLRRNHASAPLGVLEELKRLSERALREGVLEELKRLSERALREGDLDSLRGVEGQAARLYFGEFGGMLKARGFTFEGRTRRPPRDPVNALLSLGYGMLAGELTVAASCVGFDPYLGFLHAPRYGRPSLALDLMEEYRAVLVDSVALTLLNNGLLLPQHFREHEGAVLLDAEGRRVFARAYEQRLQSRLTHPLLGYEVSYRQLLTLQLRLLDRHLMGELPEYPPYQVR